MTTDTENQSNNDGTKTRTMKTTAQLIAEREADLARLKAKDTQLANGQKIILGGMLLSLAKKDTDLASKVLRWIGDNVKRKEDKKRLEPVIAELEEIILNSNTAKNGADASPDATDLTQTANSTNTPINF